MRDESQTECRSRYIYIYNSSANSAMQTSQWVIEWPTSCLGHLDAGQFIYGKTRRLLTRRPALEPDFDSVAAFRSACQMQWLMHITNKVNKEIPRLFRNLIARVVSNPALQYTRHVLHCIKDIGVFRSLPSIWTREGTLFGWMIVNRIDIVH